MSERCSDPNLTSLPTTTRALECRILCIPLSSLHYSPSSLPISARDIRFDLQTWLVIWSLSSLLLDLFHFLLGTLWSSLDERVSCIALKGPRGSKQKLDRWVFVVGCLLVLCRNEPTRYFVCVFDFSRELEAYHQLVRPLFLFLLFPLLTYILCFFFSLEFFTHSLWDSRSR